MAERETWKEQLNQRKSKSASNRLIQTLSLTNLRANALGETSGEEVEREATLPWSWW